MPVFPVKNWSCCSQLGFSRLSVFWIALMPSRTVPCHWRDVTWRGVTRTRRRSCIHRPISIHLSIYIYLLTYLFTYLLYPIRTAVETALAWYTSCYTQWRRDTVLIINTSVVLVSVHGLLGLLGLYTRSSLHSFISFSPPVPVPNRPPRLCGRKAKC